MMHEPAARRHVEQKRMVRVSQGRKQDRLVSATSSVSSRPPSARPTPVMQEQSPMARIICAPDMAPIE